MALRAGRAVSAAMLGLMAASWGATRGQAQVAPDSPATNPQPGGVASSPTTGIGPEARGQILEQAIQEAKGLGDLPRMTRRRVLLDYVLSEYAAAADIPGEDTNQLTSSQRTDASRIVNQALSSSPNPSPPPSPAPAPAHHPQPAPAPTPYPTPAPAPMPSPAPIPMPVQPIYVVVPWPQQPVIAVVQPVYFVPVVVPGRKHHFFGR